METDMPTPLLIAVALILAGYCLYYWAALTWTMIADARQQRMKQHIDWTVVRRRRPERTGWRFW